MCVSFGKKQSVKLTFAPAPTWPCCEMFNELCLIIIIIIEISSGPLVATLQRQRQRQWPHCSFWDAAGQEASPVAGISLPFGPGPKIGQEENRKTKLKILEKSSKTEKLKNRKHIWHSFGVASLACNYNSGLWMPRANEKRNYMAKRQK